MLFRGQVNDNLTPEVNDFRLLLQGFLFPNTNSTIFSQICRTSHFFMVWGSNLFLSLEHLFKLISFCQKEVSSVQHPYQASSQFILKPVIYLHMHVLHKNDYEIKKSLEFASYPSVLIYKRIKRNTIRKFRELFSCCGI